MRSLRRNWRREQGNILNVRLISGLPAYGPLPTNFPGEWGRLGREGIVVEFKTWDGFDERNIAQSEIKGLAWSPVDDQWHPFRVDLSTGKSTGGSYFTEDAEGWERCLP